MDLASKTSPKPTRIGVFIGFVDDSYQRAIWKSIVARAKERGVETIGFFGHGLRAPVPGQASMNVAYQLAGPGNVDGIIALSNTIGNFTAPTEVSRLLEHRGLPAVSIEIPLEGLPSIWASGRAAMTELVRHLARRHGRRRFALVTGPESHPDSIERESAFREALAGEGLGLDETLIHRGKFFIESGTEAVARLVDSGADFDAMVCLNDFMALGAMEALAARGIDVPESVSVTGFDDIVEARWATPPLTTARQPLDEFGRRALDMILELLSGSSPASTMFECGCVYRRSCGCSPALPLPDVSASRRNAETEGDLVLGAQLQARLASGSAVAALSLLDGAVSRSGAGSDAIGFWRRRIYEFREARKSEVSENDDKASELPARVGSAIDAPAAATRIDAYDQALAFLAEVELRREVARNTRQAERQLYLRELSSRLLGALSLDALARQWEDCVRPMGFRRGYLVLFGPQTSGALANDAVKLGQGSGSASLEMRVPATARLIGSAQDSRPGITEIEFSTRQLLPPEVVSTWGLEGWMLEPLVYQREILGYIMVESGDEDPSAYETLRAEMSAAVKGTLLMEEVQGNKRDLERLVELRTAELHRANEDLHRQIVERRALEREVQEISNRTMQAIGQDIHDDLCQHLVGISMLAAVAEESLGGAGAKPIGEIRSLLESAVERSRQFARTLYPPGLETLGLVSALEDLVDSVGRTASGVSITLQTEGDCRIHDPAKALQVYRIVQEALSNAVRHSGSADVVVRLVRRENSVVAEVRDFGAGLREGASGLGMGMRIMRYRADSIGASLDVSGLGPGVCISCSVTDAGESNG